MRSRKRLLVLLIVPLLVAGGALVAQAVSSSHGGGKLTRGIAFYGSGSGAEFPAAGTGTVPAGASKAVVTILLPANTIPHAGGGGDENHVVATIEGHIPGYWIEGAKISPPVSGYDRESGHLIVWLNRPAPANTPIPFTFMTFGIFND